MDKTKTLTKEQIEEISKDFRNSCLGRVAGKQLTAQILAEMLSYKEIEEELGISLVTLFKALKQEVIYTKYQRHQKHFLVEQRFGKYLVYDKEWLIELKEYGKTWGLTKDEIKEKNEER